MTIQEAKDTLRKEGYFIDNLWHIDDVMNDYDCDEETAQQILNDVLTQDYIMERINESIHMMAEDFYELKEKDV